MTDDPIQAVPDYWDGPHGRLAYRATPGRTGGPGFLWCGGFRSDMCGGKATELHEWAIASGHPYLRFDYDGHGESEGRFEDGTIGRWLGDCLAVLDGPADGARILVGSSMGAWIALHAALARPDRVAGLVLIAPAPDFTEDLMWNMLSAEERDAIMREGVWMQPSPYGATPITKALIEDGRSRLLLRERIAYDGPVRILQGMRDDAVPYGHALRVVDALAGQDVRITLIKDGDHRLSRDGDLRLLKKTAADLIAAVTPCERA